ncbi:MAG: hypothetical protein KBD63_06900 [Bacteriovoracaceae bacterium]|nr:hypothetical protein [Bacteriovoracaceae bacterium]
MSIVFSADLFPSVETKEYSKQPIQIRSDDLFLSGGHLTDIHTIHTSYTFSDFPLGVSVTNLGSLEKPKIRIVSPNAENPLEILTFIITKEEAYITILIQDSTETIEKKITIKPYKFSVLWKTFLDLFFSGSATKKGMLLLVKILENQGKHWNLLKERTEVKAAENSNLEASKR